MNKETFHVISNTHWDREWYLCHEKFLVRLVELMDRLVDILEIKPDYRFITDGQFALVEDYINAKPENKSRIKKLVESGQLLVGPWYTQPLENIVGGEALIRNLQKGIKLSEDLGRAMRFSYEIDEFGHTSQLPQILAGFDINGVMAWRGVPKNCKSYFKWIGPDGTKVDFFNSNAGYGEATSLPDCPDDFTEIIDGIEHKRQGLINHVNTIRDLRIAVSDSSNMLWLNGIDHSWAQEDILEIIEKIRVLFPDFNIKQSTPEEYAESVIEDLKFKGISPPEANGELMYTYEPVLESVNAFHPRQKRRHYETEKLLVRQTEPLCAISMLLGAKHPDWALERAWNNVLENHAHDSLGCCSVDEVYEQVMARYGASISLCEQINENSLRYIMSCSDEEPSLWIFNLSESKLYGSVKAEFDIPVGFGGENIKLVTVDGRNVEMAVISSEILGDVRYNPRLGHPVWGKVAHFKAIIDIGDLKAFSAKRFRIIKIEPNNYTKNCNKNYFFKQTNVLENNYLKITINQNGTFDIYDKITNHNYPNQMLLTDDGESGHCYVHIEPENDCRVFNSSGCKASVCSLYDTPLGAAAEITVIMNIPEGISDDRKRRSSHSKDIVIKYILSIEKQSRNVELKITINNTCKNHRLRALFPTYISEAEFSESGQAFDEVKRLIKTPDNDCQFEMPYATHPMQDYCAIKGNTCGLGIAARGIYEYECIDDNTKALALTLLRSIEVIDNDTFETTPSYFMQEGQNLCEINHSLTLIPFGNNKTELMKMVKAALARPLVMTNRATEDSVMPGYIHPDNILGDDFTALSVDNENIEITSFKKAYSTKDIIVRIRNRNDKEEKGNLSIEIPYFKSESIYETNLEEKNLSKVGAGNSISFSIGAKKIKTFKFTINQ